VTLCFVAKVALKSDVLFFSALNRMPRFRYRARDAQGQLVEGVIDASDRAGAIQLIEQRRCVPFKIEADAAAAAPSLAAAGGTAAAPSRGLFAQWAAAASSGSAPAVAASSERLTHGQRLFFTEQLAYLLSAGMTLDEALGILVKRLKQPNLQRLTRALHRGLIDGRSFSQALRDFPRIFSPLYVNLVLAGEASGALTDILTRLVKHLANMKVLRDRVSQALIYPAFLAVAGVALIIIFITVMVPQLETFFSNTNGGTLPLPTRLLIEANYLVTHYWWLAATVAGVGYALFKVATRSPEGRMTWDRLRLSVPGFGEVVKHQFYAQFARTMGTLLQNGVTLLKSMELLEDMSGNTYLKARMYDARMALVDGSSLSAALGKQRIFPELFLDMMAVGETSGRFAETMQMTADVYERELDSRVKVATAIIPYVIIIAIAIVVGAVVFGIISAVFSVTSALPTQVH
jgi:type II secretory pathway component PulF